jgi:tRNA threonylcarbamoyl adenosine modification protein (Sua5/YciO/YrdC/YwlC family)
MPTDASPVLACRVGEREALTRIRAIRGLDDKHLMTLICRDLSELSQYAQVDTAQFRFVREWTPGPYTFVLPATREVPRRLMHPSRRSIGLRVPSSALVSGLIEALGEPLLGTTLQLPGDEAPIADADEAFARLSRRVDLLIECGVFGREPTTVIDLTGDAPLITRIGSGDVSGMRVQSG